MKRVVKGVDTLTRQFYGDHSMRIHHVLASVLFSACVCIASELPRSSPESQGVSSAAVLVTDGLRWR